MAVTLRDLFTPLFSYVLLFTRASPAEHTGAELSADIERLLAAQDQAAKRHEIPARDYELARFAVVAWADEIIISHAHAVNQELVQQWKRSPLQKRLYNTTNAGEEFYDHLGKLTASQNGVREIYYLCLCLGFRGRYYDPSQEFKVVQLRRELREHLGERIPDVLELERTAEKLTPQPYAVNPPAARRPQRSLTMLWALLASVALAGAVLYLVSHLGRTPEEILADLNARVRGFDCAQITVAYHPDSGGVALVGHVESEAQRAQVGEAVRKVPEVASVRDTMTVLPRPFCAVIALLGPLRGAAGDDSTHLSVRLQNGCDTVYRSGETLVFTIDSDRPLDHVYLDYYVADRETVGHLFPGSGDGDATVAAKTLSVGGPDSATQWVVKPPFGMELITAVSSPELLFASHLPAVEKASTYIDALREVLPEDASSTAVTATYCFITTSGQ